MLDAYIIDRIRRERESRERAQVPLRIEIPMPPMPSHRRPNDETLDNDAREDRDDREERGIAIIDFTL
jgi:hypothetical protein